MLVVKLRSKQAIVNADIIPEGVNYYRRKSKWQIVMLTEISRQRLHTHNLLLIESTNPQRLTLIVKSKNMLKETEQLFGGGKKEIEILSNVTLQI